ncbi:hypothetical protein KM043_013105 [Ampulex compressa]|nr:hypothetical protein KM043_013105 [Ampulex compressa]
MKLMVVLCVVVAMAVAYPERDRRSVLPVVAPLLPATAVIGPKTATVVAAAAAPAVVAAPAAAVVAHGYPLVKTIW